MANRRYRNQFLYSMQAMPVMIAGKMSLVQAVKAVKVTQGLTLTAVLFGISGNAITIAFTPGATAGAEVVTVTGNAISVQIETGVSTVTQVRTAMQAAAACTALVTTTGTNASTVATAAALPLLGGIDGVASHTFGNLVASCARTGVGEYTITLADNYYADVSPQFQLLAATAVDLVPQLKSIDVITAKTIVVRLLAGATATEVAAAASLYMHLIVNNSSVAT